MTVVQKEQRPSYTTIRRIVLRGRHVTEESKGHGPYRVDRTDASQYFYGIERWREKVANFLHDSEEEGGESVHVDICGNARAFSLGATKSYGFSLERNVFPTTSARSAVDIYGDIFNVRDIILLENTLKENGDSPGLITFNPIVGLQSQNPDHRIPFHQEVTYQQLENVLRRMVAVLKEGGYIFLDRPFQLDPRDACDFMLGRTPQEYQRSKELAGLCIDLNCSIQYARTIDGVKHLLKKKKPKRKPKA